MALLRSLNYGLAAALCAALIGCSPDYSPNIYSGEAVQQANTVDRGVVIGFRQIAISADGTVGAVTGGAAGGILGAQADDVSHVTSALGALGGTVVGGVVGTTIQHVVGKSTGWEYIVRKPNGDLLSVTQEEPTPLPIGQKVLVITGKQARIVADYSVELPSPPVATLDKDKEKSDQTTPLPARDAATSEPNPSPVIPAAATTTASPAASPPVATATTAAPPATISASLPAMPSSEPENPAPPDSAAPPPPAANGNAGNATPSNNPPS
jgi:outer membrane lipoprotein SlyB